MTKTEFEKMTIRENSEKQEISTLLYDTVEHFYMADNEYHEHNNAHGINETKQEFVKRVFGGKINTPKTILKKIIAESIRENRYALQGCNIDKTELDRMDSMISEHYTYLAKNNF